ncbi:unnamed protein product [Closterium sp. NIES-65]|nr:unnamed protein product [Closterium sp. NIES-65]CAI5984516.1 unnamed protein product [Closterium sp. NIES-65]
MPIHLVCSSPSPPSLPPLPSSPIMFFRISGRTGELQEVDDEEAERIMPAAAYALAKKSLHLTPSGFTLTLRGAICFTEDDVINLDTELGFGIGGSLAEGVDITTFLSGGQEYMIYTPFDPLMFVAYKDPKTSEILVAEDPELLNDPKVLDAIDEEQQFQALVEAEEEMEATLEQTARQAPLCFTQEEMKATLEQTARQAPLRSHDPPAALSSCPIHPFTPLASSQEAEEETEATLEQTARQAAFCSRELSHGLSCPLTLLPFPLLSMYVLPRRPKRRWRQHWSRQPRQATPHNLPALSPPCYCSRPPTFSNLQEAEEEMEATLEQTARQPPPKSRQQQQQAPVSSRRGR